MPGPPFTISARSGAARAGVLRTLHGDVRTPAFVPLASTATVKSLHASEVAALGYELVLGNTFHLFIQPGPELIGELGGLHEFMGWRGAIVTDSGGYQVFSMGHGSVAEEVKRRRDPRESMVLSIEEEGVRFRSYLDGSERFMGPETSMEIQGALGTDIALAFDECTPFHVEREYTARSLERTQRWLERCLAWRREHAPAGQLFYGIVQGGVHRDLRAEATAYLRAASGVDGIAIGGSLGKEKEQIREVVGWVLDGLSDEQPRHLLGIGDVDDLVHAVGAGVDTFDCATPTRLARHGTALVARAGVALAPRPQPPRPPGRPGADRRPLRLPRLRRAHPRLPALPDPRRRADRKAAAHPAQPDLHAAPDARHARGHRGRRLPRLRPPGARRRGSLRASPRPTACCPR